MDSAKDFVLRLSAELRAGQEKSSFPLMVNVGGAEKERRKCFSEITLCEATKEIISDDDIDN